jgi:hypothetical protein
LLETLTQSASLHEFGSATSPGKRRNTSDEDPKFGNRGSNSTEVIPSRSPFSHETVGYNNGDLLNDSPIPQDIPESSPQVPDNLTIPASHTIRSGSVGAVPFTIQNQAENTFLQKQLNEAGVQRKAKWANKKTSRQPARPGEPYPRPDSTGEFCSPTTPHSTGSTNTPTPSDAERQLIGSLTDSYGFKLNGLVKKTMSATVRGVISARNPRYVPHFPSPSSPRRNKSSIFSQ